jgi:sugar-specific transcriptional regulator TrmB
LALSEEVVADVLRGFGLTNKECEVYIFLASGGIRKAGEISDTLKMHKPEVYHILKGLEEKRLVESTLEAPLRFTATPFEKVLDLIISSKREESILLEGKKAEILSQWRSVTVERPIPAAEKFMVISGNANIYSKNLEMIDEAGEEILALVANLGMIQPHLVDELGFVSPMENRSIRMRVLTPVVKDNTAVVKWALKEISTKKINVSIRHANLRPAFFPNLMVKDSDEALLLVTPHSPSSAIGEKETCLWTNSKAVVQMLMLFFEGLWQDAADADAKISELESGTPLEETVVLKNAKQAYEKFRATMEGVREDIVIVTSSQGLARLGGAFPMEKWSQRGVNIRLMAPITQENLGIARHLSQFIQIRGINTAYVSMIIIDHKYLLSLKTPPANEDTLDPDEYFDHMLYTNEPIYVKGMGDLLDELWRGASAIP